MKLRTNKLTTSHLPTGFTLLEIVVSAAVFSVAMLVAVGLFVAVTQVQKKTQSLSKVQGDARFALELMAQSVRVDGLDYSYYLDSNDEGQRSDYAVNLTSTAASELVTKNNQGQRRFYRHYDPGSGYVIGVCEQDTINATENGRCTTNANFTVITPANVLVEIFKVWIRPASDPYDLPPKSNGDCKNTNYDSTRGVCSCTAATVATDCFRGQTCDERAGASFCARANDQPRATIVIKSSGGSARQQEKAEVTLQTTVASRMYKR